MSEKMMLASEASDEASRQSSKASEASRDVEPPKSPEERAASLADQIQALTFTAWARKETEHHEAAQLLARKVVKIIRQAENAAVEKAARIVETAPQSINWRESRERAALKIRALKHPIATG